MESSMEKIGLKLQGGTIFHVEKPVVNLISEQQKKIIHQNQEILNMRQQISEMNYALLDMKSILLDEKVLFIDLGANLGQGFSWFSKFFDLPNVDFELFEPNPNCIRILSELPQVKSGTVVLHNVAVGTETGFCKLYGLFEESGGGEFSQGGSILKDHNSKFYQSSDATAVDVQVINFQEFLEKKKPCYNKIIVKMDIEGFEVPLLEHLIRNQSIELIDILYVEFHSQYQKEENRELTKEREEKIRAHLEDKTGLAFREWH